MIVDMDSIQGVIGDWESFIQTILDKTVKSGFDLSDFIQMDHICYRTTSINNYTQKKDELSKLGSLLGETMINGRPIATFRLNKPLIYQKWRVDAIELPAPKAGKVFSEGLEHVEFVLYDDMHTFINKYPGQDFDKRAIDRGINPELGFSFDKYAIKFHLLNLPTVVYLENKLGITDVAD
jgi:predicted metalloenzyme YecM